MHFIFSNFRVRAYRVGFGPKTKKDERSTRSENPLENAEREAEVLISDKTMRAASESTRKEQLAAGLTVD